MRVPVNDPPMIAAMIVPRLVMTVNRENARAELVSSVLSELRDQSTLPVFRSHCTPQHGQVSVHSPDDASRDEQCGETAAESKHDRCEECPDAALLISFEPDRALTITSTGFRPILSLILTQ